MNSNIALKLPANDPVTLPLNAPTVGPKRHHIGGAFSGSRYAGLDVSGPEEAKMAEFTRGEFDARLEATEERMNARLAGIEATLGILVNKIDGLSGQVADTKSEARYARDEAARARDAALGGKWSVIGTVIATGIASVALVYAILAYGLQNFEAAIAAIQAVGGAR